MTHFSFKRKYCCVARKAGLNSGLDKGRQTVLGTPTDEGLVSGEFTYRATALLCGRHHGQFLGYK